MLCCLYTYFMALFSTRWLPCSSLLRGLSSCVLSSVLVECCPPCVGAGSVCAGALRGCGSTAAAACAVWVLVAAGVLLSCAWFVLAVGGRAGLCWVGACASGCVSGWCLVGVVGVVARQFWWWLNSGRCFWWWPVDGWQWLGVGLVHRWHRALFGGHRLALYCPREVLRVALCWLRCVWLRVAGVRG